MFLPNLTNVQSIRPSYFFLMNSILRNAGQPQLSTLKQNDYDKIEISYTYGDAYP